MLSGTLTGSAEKVGEANLNGRMNMKLWLLDSENTLIIPKAGHNHWDHLRYANAHIARCYDDSLLIAKGNFRPGLQARVKLLKLPKVVVCQSSFEKLMKPAGDWDFLKFDFLQLVPGSKSLFAREPSINVV